VSTGHGFCGIGRKQAAVMLLQARARELGVDLRFETKVGSAADVFRRITIWLSPPTG
jgi:anthraniloyl-CoA monooxygenase